MNFQREKFKDIKDSFDNGKRKISYISFKDPLRYPEDHLKYLKAILYDIVRVNRKFYYSREKNILRKTYIRDKITN